MTTLRDFFGDETTFIAYGNERYAMDDFEMDNNGKHQCSNSIHISIIYDKPLFYLDCIEENGAKYM